MVSYSDCRHSLIFKEKVGAKIFRPYFFRLFISSEFITDSFDGLDIIIADLFP